MCQNCIRQINSSSNTIINFSQLLLLRTATVSEHLILSANQGDCVLLLIALLPVACSKVCVARLKPDMTYDVHRRCCIFLVLSAMKDTRKLIILVMFIIVVVDDDDYDGDDVGNNWKCIKIYFFLKMVSPKALNIQLINCISSLSFNFLEKK